jgi:twitching motility protein PilT
MPIIDQLFQKLIELGGSDLHLSQGQPPKCGCTAASSPSPTLLSTDLHGGHDARDLRPSCSWERFQTKGDLDFAYEMDANNRFRCNYLKQLHGYGAVFRIIPTKIASLEQLGIPQIVKEFGHLRSGLVLVTGPTGSGKSTTLAALIDYINTNFRRHIITMEEPIEFVHRNKKSIITQREVPIQTHSFSRRS